MLTNEDKYRILEIAKHYNVSKLYLFGSHLGRKKEPEDIDLAVEGISDSKFFEFYGKLIFALSKPIDLIDLKKKSLFSELIKSEGMLIYG